MNKYRLRGKCIVIQYCHIKYPEKTGLAVLTRCASRDHCAYHQIVGGHEITLDVDEIVEASSPDEAIGGLSLSQYEYSERNLADGDGLEPTWVSTPKVTLLE